MSVFFYYIILFVLRAGTILASPFHAKARKWVLGRRKIFSRIKSAIPAHEKVIWVHCASLGEFEQGRPLMEEIRLAYPSYKILLTFYSPSGYEAKKNYPGADWIFYLPIDGPRNARLFLEIVHPSLVIFVKYEFWYFFLKKIKYRKVPLLLVSALFRKDMSFFSWYGGLQRKILSRFDHLFVQNASSLELLDQIGLGSISSIAGDTRYDRVISIAEKSAPDPLVESFIGSSKAIVAGSTWPEDEAALQFSMKMLENKALKWIIAPHEISKKHLDELAERFPGALFYSTLDEQQIMNREKNILIIDNIGLLSRIYRYAYIAYIGGGLRVMGVHNVLEAAVYGKVVITGPYYHKYAEAVGLVQSGGAVSFTNENVAEKGLTELIIELLENREAYETHCLAARAFVYNHKGATGQIMNFIQEKRLLTS